MKQPNIQKRSLDESSSIKPLKKNASIDVVVLGAGAAGLFCAFTAAKRGRRVLVLEKANKVGKKILMSGGGRCNFTNQYIESDNYISHNPHFCKSAFSRFTQWDFIAMVEQYGIAYEERKHHQLFCENSAKDILNMLLNECEQSGVEILSDVDVLNVGLAVSEMADIASKQANYRLQFSHQLELYDLSCESLVVATGALSIPTLGGSGLGYDIAKQFDLSLTDRRAGLVPFMFTDNIKKMCERLAGVSIDISVACHSQSFRENLLFTHRGISGPAILQISSYWYPGDVIIIDLMPDEDATQFLLSAKKTNPKNQLTTILSHSLGKALTKELQQLWWAESSERSLAEFSDKKLQEIGQKINQWKLKPSATEGYRTAEVTLGGVDTKDISSKTMESKKQKGLFFIGEVIDVSGHLGGYNFQWAWSSGYTAGLFV